jgi:hypothetical protein
MQALILYIGMRHPNPGPLFDFNFNLSLTQEPRLLGPALFHTCKLRSNRLVWYYYNGHSFRIGAATSAAQQGLEDSLIRTLGSDAYKTYIKLPQAQLATCLRHWPRAIDSLVSVALVLSAVFPSKVKHLSHV